MKYRVAISKDLPRIEEILKQSNLPAEDCLSHLDNFVVHEEKEKVVGIGGLEIYGQYGLLRSIVVIPEYRGRGITKEILAILENRAYKSGVQKFFLLTETASDYFIKLGFSVIEREETPAEIVKTRQFSELCPSSAKAMSRSIVRN